MIFDFKREYKDLYNPKNSPSIVNVGKCNYLAVRGRGNPNLEDGEYKKSIELLYNVEYTIKMSYKSSNKIKDFYQYVVPPLEGFWWQDGVNGLDYNRKDDMCFISIMRLPDFVTKEVFNWAINEVTRKKKRDFSKVEFLSYDEGICVQSMHIGSYDDEPATIEKMHKYIEDNGYELDLNNNRYHHEVYLSDPRKCDVSKLKTIIRHPIRKINL